MEISSASAMNNRHAVSPSTPQAGGGGGSPNRDKLKQANSSALRCSINLGKRWKLVLQILAALVFVSQFLFLGYTLGRLIRLELGEDNANMLNGVRHSHVSQVSVFGVTPTNSGGLQPGNGHIPYGKTIEKAYATRHKRVYYRANPQGCGLRFDDGCAAGPYLPNCPINYSQQEGTAIANCDPFEELNRLDAVQALANKRAVQLFLPHIPMGVFDNWVFDRIRRSSATDIVFIDKHHLVAGQFATKKVHLYEYSLTTDNNNQIVFSSTLLDSVDSSGHIELLDYNGKGLIIGAIFHSGAQDLFKVDLKKQRIYKHKTIFAFGENTEKCHGRWVCSCVHLVPVSF